MQSLSNYLVSKGVEVSFNLEERGLDIILLFDPRRSSPSSAFTHAAILRYLLLKNPRAIVIHRINECDERKNTTGVNKLYMNANRCADHTVFVSRWLERLYLEQGIGSPSRSVILNGSDSNLFRPNHDVAWNGRGPLKVVTHHWGADLMKGFDIYRLFDEMLGDRDFRKRYSFTYIGQLPKGFYFRNAEYIEPHYGEELAALLGSHHVYLTASKNEPGSNHQNEGACCGLPLLYRDSASMREYGEGFGLSYTTASFVSKLEEMRSEYFRLRPLMSGYQHTADNMCKSYYELFQDLVSRRDDVLSNRQWSSNIPWVSTNILKR